MNSFRNSIQVFHYYIYREVQFKYKYYSTMFNLLQQIDFSKELLQQPQLQAYIKQAALQIQKQNNQELSKFNKPTFDEDLQNHLIVTNIPDIKGKQEAFLKLFNTLLDKKAIGVKDGLLSVEPGYVGANEDKKYNRTLYMIYKNSAMAKKAYQKLHQLKFTKEHTLACFTVKQFKDVQKIDKKYKQPKLFFKKQLIGHNLDEKFRDQFIYINKENNSNKINNKWFDYIEKKIDDVSLSENKSQISIAEDTKNVIFSKTGNYLAICQAKGISLLAGDKLSEKGFYPHEGVTDVVFSPHETFMISYNKNSHKTRSQECFKIWAVQSQILLVQYKAQQHHSLSSFQFSNDETKIAVVLNNEFVVYQSESPQKLKRDLKLSQDQLVNQGRLIKTANIQKIIWLPDGVSVVCICYEINPQINAHSTSKIFTYNTETKEEKKWKAIGQNIKNVETAISSNGEWIAVSFDKIQKKNNSTSVIYIVNLKKRQIETQVVQFKDNIVSISWDKKNNIFGAVTQLPVQHKNEDVKFGVHFYQIVTKDKIQQAIKFAQIPVTPTNRIIIAQNGIFFALYNVSPLSWGKYKYSIGSFNRDTKTKKLTIEMIKQNLQIPYMTYFNMDESGRFILTGTDKTFQIWTTAGQLISKDMFSNEIKYVQFRPRQTIKLTKEEQTKLQEKQKQIKKKYEQEDGKRISQIQDQQKLQKERKRDEFKKYLQEKRKWFTQFRQTRSKLLGFDQEDPKVKSTFYQIEYVERNN